VSLDRLSFLVGTWRGEGRGDYPTIDAFTYAEELEFGTVPTKPFVTYRQRTTGTDGLPLHSEVGYVRSPAAGLAEMVIAQPTGVTEIQTGAIEGTSLILTSMGVGLTPTAKDIRTVHRRIDVIDDVLRYRLDLAAVGEDLQFHLEAELTRI
jgi:hypothetical protein